MLEIRDNNEMINSRNTSAARITQLYVVFHSLLCDPRSLFFSFFEDYMFPKFRAIFLELQFFLHSLLILARPIDLARGFVSELYELCLGHVR